MGISSRVRLVDRTMENDIKFRGPLSYRHLRIMAWFFLVLAQIATILALNMKVNKASIPIVEPWQKTLSYASYLPLPLFLIANFSAILQNKGNYKRMFIFYGGIAGGLYILSNFLVFHYGYGMLNAIDQEINLYDACKFFGSLLISLGKQGYILNIFIDLLLCSLMFFFMDYKPKKVFVGKKLIIFRLFILLPVAYEVLCVILKYCIYESGLIIPSYVFFLLPSKPPFLLFAFLLLVVGFKLSERLFLRRHNDEARYENYLHTNAHALKMSIAICIIMVVSVIVDLFTYVLIMAIVLKNAGIPLNTDAGQFLTYWEAYALTDSGFLGSLPFILILPVVMFFDYRKTYQNKLVDLLIPIGGLALVLLVYLEGIFQVISKNLPYVLQNLADKIEKFLNGDTAEEEGATTTASAILKGIKSLISRIR